MGRVGDDEIATLPSEARNNTLFCLANKVLSCQRSVVLPVKRCLANKVLSCYIIFVLIEKRIKANE